LNELNWYPQTVLRPAWFCQPSEDFQDLTLSERVSRQLSGQYSVNFLPIDQTLPR
jgi:hypothetical protein